MPPAKKANGTAKAPAADAKKKASSASKPRASTSSTTAAPAAASKGKAPAKANKAAAPAEAEAVKPKKATKAKAAAAAAPASASESADIIDGHVSIAQCKKAFEALIAHNKKHNKEKKEAGGKTDLLNEGDEEEEGKSDEETVEGDSSNKRENAWLQITMKQLHDKKQVKPQQVPLRFPLYNSSSSVCLLVKDPQREYKDLLVEQKITSISRVVGVAKLKGKFKPFDARRQLLQDHDVFLADDRIVRMLPVLLGKKFFDAKKQPILVDISKKKNVKEHIQKALSGTAYIRTPGTTTSTALPHIISKIPGNWSNIQGLEVKLGASASLPIWNCDLGDSDMAGENNRWNRDWTLDSKKEAQATFDKDGKMLEGKEAEALNAELEKQSTEVIKAHADDAKAKKLERQVAKKATRPEPVAVEKKKKSSTTAAEAVKAKVPKADKVASAAKAKAKTAATPKLKKVKA